MEGGVMACSVGNFINNWNADLPEFPLTMNDLKNSTVVMGAIFKVFDRLGIDLDAVLAPPPEESQNENTIYYWDLLPMINTIRVLRHLVSVTPQTGYEMVLTPFLQPQVNTSHSMLFLLYNKMVFNEVRLENITPYEKELLSKTEMVKTLENHKNHLLKMLNEQAEENGRRAQRLEMIDQNIKQFEEELKQEKEIYDEDKQEWKAISKENHDCKIILEQKKSQRDALLSEIEKTNALRVYDADDIKAQVEIATRNVQEAEDKMNKLHNTLMEKENSLKNLQTIKPNLETANHLLHEIIKLSEIIRYCENGDLDSDIIESDLDDLNTEVLELEALLSDLRVSRTEVANGEKNMMLRQQEERQLLSKLREAEEKDKKDAESSIKVAQQVEELKKLTIKYEREKADRLEQLDQIKNDFVNNLKQMQDILLIKTQETKKRIEDALKNRG